MDRSTLISLAIAVVILIVLVFTLGGDRESARLAARIDAEATNLADAQRQFDVDQKKILDALETEPVLFQAKSFDELWPPRLQQVATQLKDAQKELEAAKARLETIDADNLGEIEGLLRTIQAQRVSAAAAVSEMGETTKRYLDFKRSLAKSLAQMEQEYNSIATVDLAQVKALVAKAAADWPEKKGFLEGRLSDLERTIERSNENWSSSEDLRKKDSSQLLPDDYERLLALGSAFHIDSENVQSEVTRLPGLIEELYWSWDKVLVDMEIREGREVTFYQKFRIIKTHVADSRVPTSQPTEEDGSQKVEPNVEEELVQIPKKTYHAMEDYLGMTVEHKSAGKFNSEAEKVVQPPGYAYMCPPSERRNRYGHWENRGGSSFWVFYGQYALMRDLFWGGGRSSWVDSRSYDGYTTARRSGRTYYGRDAAGRSRFGKNGTFTKSRYGNSRYVSTSGYKNSRYISSGRTYRGSRYQTRSRTRTSSRSRGRSFGGGSRFGFGK